MGIVAALLALVATAGVAGAQSSAAVYIRGVDSTEPSKTAVQYVATSGDGSGATVTVNGQQKQAQITKLLDTNPKVPVGIELVIDTGPNMSNTNALVSAKEAAKNFVREATGKGVEVAIYQAGDKGNLVQSFTTDTNKATAAIDKLTPSKGSAIWSALRQAGASFGAGSKLQPNIVLVVGDNDNVTPSDQPAARGAVLSSGASLFAVEYLGGGLEPEPINSLVAETGGNVQSTGDPGAVGGQLTNAQNLLLNQQYQAIVDTGLKNGQVAEIGVSVGGSSATASVVLGGVVEGKQQLNPEVVSSSGPLSFLSNGLGLLLGLVLVLAAVAFFIYALVALFVPDNSLSNVLQPYAEGYGGDSEFEDDGNASLAKTEFLKKAVELTEQVAESQGYLGRAEAALERANVPLRAGEALFFYVALVAVVTILILLLSRSFILGLIAGVLAAIIPVAVVNFKAGRRRAKFMEQLPDTLSLLSGTLRAGYSLMQGVEAVSQEVEDPMGLELRRVVTEARLGRPLEESLEGAAERMDSADFSWAVMAIRIQREVGGNLSELLLTVAETMTARERLRRDVRTLTAEGRMSAIVLGVLPIGLGAIMFVINPQYMGQLYKTGLGIGLSIVAGVSMLIGFFWMKKIINIEI